MKCPANSTTTSSAGNKSWTEKILYFKHLAENDIQIKNELGKEAALKGITLSPQTICLLCAARHASHIKQIVLAENDRWSKKLIEMLSERI